MVHLPVFFFALGASHPLVIHGLLRPNDHEDDFGDIIVGSIRAGYSPHCIPGGQCRRVCRLARFARPDTEPFSSDDVRDWSSTQIVASMAFTACRADICESLALSFPRVRDQFLEICLLLIAPERD